MLYHCLGLLPLDVKFVCAVTGGRNSHVARASACWHTLTPEARTGGYPTGGNKGGHVQSFSSIKLKAKTSTGYGHVKVKSYGGSGFVGAGIKSRGGFFGKFSGGGYHNGDSKVGNHDKISSGHNGNHGHNHEKPESTARTYHVNDSSKKDTAMGATVTYTDKAAGDKSGDVSRVVTTDPWDYKEKSSSRWPSKRSYGGYRRSVGYSGNHGHVSISYRPKPRVAKKSFISSRYRGPRWGKRSNQKPSAHRRISYSKRSYGKRSYGRRSVSKRPWGRTYW